MTDVEELAEIIKRRPYCDTQEDLAEWIIKHGYARTKSPKADQTFMGIPIEIREDCPKGQFYLVNKKYMKSEVEPKAEKEFKAGQSIPLTEGQFQRLIKHCSPPIKTGVNYELLKDKLGALLDHNEIMIECVLSCVKDALLNKGE